MYFIYSGSFLIFIVYITQLTSSLFPFFMLIFLPYLLYKFLRTKKIKETLHMKQHLKFYSKSTWDLTVGNGVCKLFFKIAIYRKCAYLHISFLFLNIQKLWKILMTLSVSTWKCLSWHWSQFIGLFDFAIKYNIRLYLHKSFY